MELAGVTMTPHLIAPSMRYAKAPDPSLGARVQLFLRNAGKTPLHFEARSGIRFRGKTPAELLAADAWAWHDLPGAWPEDSLTLPPGAMTVWSFNGCREDWGVGTSVDATLELGREHGPQSLAFDLARPDAWIAAVTFLGAEDRIYPDRMVAHITNSATAPLRIVSCRLWLPESNATWRALHARDVLSGVQTLPADGMIPPGDKGILIAVTGDLPRTYVIVELQTELGGVPRTLWAHLRVKREAFDISGGWVNSTVNGKHTLTFEPFLKTLKRMHINTAHIGDNIPGYTDQTGPDGLYTRYPLKFFHKLQPFEHYDTNDMLLRIHAAEFIGEPQYGGGRPVPPMEVWQAFAPYQRTRIATTVTHSEERIWRFYAGLSDYPHYDAYRVTAPSPDMWRKYDRWGDVRIAWGAPLETIGDMCRSLRELNRPMPTAYWSQGPHEGWGMYGWRRRTSPTPDEIRLQAYHALSSRITSLYWFNLSLKSLVKFRDTLDELVRCGREMRMLEDFYLEGDAYRWEQVRRDGKQDWELASVVAPQGAVLFALDLDYAPHPEDRVFVFGPPRESTFTFALPAWLRHPAEVFRVDADGVYDVGHELADQGVIIRDTAHKVAIYVASAKPGMRDALETKRRSLASYEAAFDFNPAHNDADFEVLAASLR
ncbi:MAG TPA: hypothetical protein ENN65_07545 [Candidatus Hydrogenedentes bacterium]|nr:hypothetical protein [Candidatus Hydrogenedentota bacterium]